MLYSEPQLSSPSENKAVTRGKRRKKTLIGTEFSPSEWNINNINKYKKYILNSLVSVSIHSVKSVSILSVQLLSALSHD